MMAEVPQRQAYGIALAEYGDRNPDVVVLDADVSSSTLTKFFAERHPTRFFNLGVTEASMVDVGVGFALSGKIPFVNTFAALLTLLFFARELARLDAAARAAPGATAPKTSPA